MKKIISIILGSLLLVSCASIKKIELQNIDKDSILNKSNQVTFLNYVVKRGDCLWDISNKKYQDPFMWWAIYKVNRDVIGSSPDLIDIGQEFKIEYDYSKEEINYFKNKAYEY